LLEHTQVTAIEKDDILAHNLQIALPKITVINKDFLEIREQDLSLKNAVMFGSLPYNVSKKIIRHALTFNEIQTFYFIIQKEVAEKYCSKEPNNNPLALEMSFYAEVKKIFDISPESFRPRPKVTSSFIKIERKSSDSDIANINFEEFTNFVHLCFRHPRRTLQNNLKDIEKNHVLPEDLLSKRPQELNFDQYLTIFRTCYNSADEKRR